MISRKEEEEDEEDGGSGGSSGEVWVAELKWPRWGGRGLGGVNFSEL